MKPLVSVIIPAYNQAGFIAGAVKSVRAQEYAGDRIEIIVIDDGSTDGTGDVVKGLGGDIRYHYQENAGKAAATACGISMASGELIFNLDPDDEFVPGKISAVAGKFEKYPAVTHVGHPVTYWCPERASKHLEKIPRDILGHEVAGMDLLRRFVFENRFYGGGSSFAGRASVLKNISIPAEAGFSVDAYMVYFLLTAGNSFYVEEPLSLYRVHAGAYSSKGRHERAIIDSLAEKAIYLGMKNSGVPLDVEGFFRFRSFLSDLKLTELTGQKKLGDILRLWREAGKVSRESGVPLRKVISSYNVLNRSLPGFMSKMVRAGKAKFRKRP